MDNLQFIKQQLIAQIEGHQVSSATEIIQFQFTVTANINILCWLKAQSSYPQVYLNMTEGSNVLACIGQVRSFSTMSQAQQFVQQQHLPLVGGVQFCGQPHFILPRLMLQQIDQHLSVRLFISQQDFSQDKLQALSVLKQLDKLTALSAINNELHIVQQKADQLQWCAWVEEGLNLIKQGELGKIVLANESIFKTLHSLNPLDFLAESEQHNIGCYHFLWALNEQSVFLGSTPELLYRRQGQQLQTEALAGTAFMTEDNQLNEQQGQWLLQDPKNEYENQLVVKGICEQLTPLVTDIQITEVALKKLRKVQHLKRSIYAQLKSNCSDQQILAAIHPTAAIAGLPQQAAQSAVQNIENFDRTWYAGALGVMEVERAEFCVTIRSAFIEPQTQGSQLRIFAGAGIVEGSVPILEWQEIERKAASLLSLLQHQA